MRKRASVFLVVGVVVALQAPLPIASLASDGGDPEAPAKQEGEDRWVPSLAISAGATIQELTGSADSVHFPDGIPTPVPLRGFVEGDDLGVFPFVGGGLEVMTPALPIPTRPRLFLRGEVLPTFSSDRVVAVEGNPGCVRGPEPNAPCATDEPTDPDTGLPLRDTPFGVDDTNGRGSKTTAWVDTLVFGASLGAAFPLRIGKRQLRIKPSAGWIRYEVEAEGLVVDAACDPSTRCTDVGSTPGFLRQPESITASKSQTFNAIGPGLDVEMDTGRFGPIGSSIFLGGGAYRVLGDRTISFGTTETYDDQIGTDLAVAQFEVEVDPWMFRAHVGIRFQWLGSRD